MERAAGVAQVVRVWCEGSARGVLRVSPGVAPRAGGWGTKSVECQRVGMARDRALVEHFLRENGAELAVAVRFDQGFCG